MINHIKNFPVKKIPVEADKWCENLYISSDKNRVVNAIELNSVINSAIIVWSNLVIESYYKLDDGGLAQTVCVVTGRQLIIK